jgi:hypothetical protein
VVILSGTNFHNFQDYLAQNPLALAPRRAATIIAAAIAKPRPGGAQQLWSPTGERRASHLLLRSSGLPPARKLHLIEPSTRRSQSVAVRPTVTSLALVSRTKCVVGDMSVTGSLQQADIQLVEIVRHWRPPMHRQPPDQWRAGKWPPAPHRALP